MVVDEMLDAVLRASDVPLVEVSGSRLLITRNRPALS
jgi:hypothetical protein